MTDVLATASVPVLGTAIFTEAPEPILRFFAYKHLPPNLAAVSEGYHNMAHGLVNDLPRSAERTVALRKLLESKDAAVRAALPV